MCAHSCIYCWSKFTQEQWIPRCFRFRCGCSHWYEHVGNRRCHYWFPKKNNNKQEIIERICNQYSKEVQSSVQNIDNLDDHHVNGNSYNVYSVQLEFFQRRLCSKQYNEFNSITHGNTDRNNVQNWQSTLVERNTFNFQYWRWFILSLKQDRALRHREYSAQNRMQRKEITRLNTNAWMLNAVFAFYINLNQWSV